jgi:hypothetical protein
MHKLGKECPAVRSYCVGRDIGGEYNLGAVYVVDDLAGYREYLHSPIHRTVDEMGLPLIQGMVSFDISDNGEPALASKIAELHKQRFAGDQKLTDLVTGLGSYTGSGKPE